MRPTRSRSTTTTVKAWFPIRRQEQDLLVPTADAAADAAAAALLAALAAALAAAELEEDPPYPSPDQPRVNCLV